MTNILDQFEFPIEAQRDLSERGLTETVSRAVGGVGGVSNLEFSGFDKGGVAYRFFVKEVKSQEKSEVYDMEINDEIEMIQWFRDKKTKPSERVTFLPEELLKFAKKRVAIGNGNTKTEFLRDEKGNLICKSGLYAEAYKAFKAGLGAQGLPLERWGKATLAQVATLKSEGIFTVQQLAALPIDRVEGVWPKDLVILFNDAIHFVRAQEGVNDIKPFADEMIAMKKQLSKKDDEVAELKAQMAQILQATSIKPEAAKKKGPKAKKSIVKTGDEFSDIVEGL